LHTRAVTIHFPVIITEGCMKLNDFSFSQRFLTTPKKNNSTPVRRNPRRTATRVNSPYFSDDTTGDPMDTDVGAAASVGEAASGPPQSTSSPPALSPKNAPRSRDAAESVRPQSKEIQQQVTLHEKALTSEDANVVLNAITQVCFGCGVVGRVVQKLAVEAKVNDQGFPYWGSTFETRHTDHSEFRMNDITGLRDPTSIALPTEFEALLQKAAPGVEINIQDLFQFNLNVRAILGPKLTSTLGKNAHAIAEHNFLYAVLMLTYLRKLLPPSP